MARMLPVVASAQSSTVWPGATVMVLEIVCWPGSRGFGSRPGCDQASAAADKAACSAAVNGKRKLDTGRSWGNRT